jgi:hypothetical protein
VIHLVIVGKGSQVFRDGVVTRKLRLADANTLRSGVVVLCYEPECGGTSTAA